MFNTNAQRAAIIGLAVLLVLAAFAVAASYVKTGSQAAPNTPEQPPVDPAGAGGLTDGAPADGQSGAGALRDGTSPADAGSETTPSSRDGSQAASEGPPAEDRQPADSAAAGPASPLTWGELLALMQTAFDPAAAPALSGAEPVNLLVPGTDPAAPVTRAGLATAIVRALDLEDAAAALMPAESMFQDISPLHRAFPAVAMAHRLGLIPEEAGGMVRPEQPATHAEARKWIDAASRLDIRSGRLAQVNVPGGSLSVVPDGGEAAAFVLAPDTGIVRNGQQAGAEALRVDDTVRVAADPTGQLKVVVAAGPEVTTAEEAMEAIAVLLRELLTPEQTAAILAQDWERAGDELKVSLYNQLLKYGLTPEEADAVVSQDWPALTEYGKSRLTELAAARWGLEPELVRALLDQDWDTAVNYAEVMVLEYLLNELMEAANA
ncbi:MAG: hypothetical protein DIU82_10985 [Bacillota bacterium]|nr:MAG: hypothetical protein DIU82_10985 [Bacillota bacterium]